MPEHDELGTSDHRLFDRVVGPYARTRPDYAAEAVDWLAERTGATAASRVLDLGAGTGKLTAMLVARGLEVVAVEPLPGMRARLAHELPPVDVRDGSAEQIPLADASLDVVCVAQAFHWFDPVPALAEIARVLAPGGCLALVWNLWDLGDPAQAALDRIVSPLGTGEIRHITTGNHPYGRWPGALDADARFGPPERARFPHAAELGSDQIAERVASMSQVQSATADARDDAIARARALVEAMPGERATFRYETEIDIRRRR
jgi:SAM-dependent methyltransferase